MTFWFDEATLTAEEPAAIEASPASSSTCTPFMGEVRTRGWLLAVVRNLVTTSSHAKPRVGIVLDRSDLLHLGRLARSTGTRTYVLQVTFIVETLSFDAVQLIMSPS